MKWMVFLLMMVAVCARRSDRRTDPGSRNRERTLARFTERIQADIDQLEADTTKASDKVARLNTQTSDMIERLQEEVRRGDLIEQHTARAAPAPGSTNISAQMALHTVQSLETLETVAVVVDSMRHVTQRSWLLSARMAHMNARRYDQLFDNLEQVSVHMQTGLFRAGEAVTDAVAQLSGRSHRMLTLVRKLLTAASDD